MALFDFLSNYVVQPQQASPGMPAVNDPGGIGVQPAVGATAARPGMTYGDVASMLMKYGSKPGSSGPMFAQTVPGQTAQPVGQLQDFGTLSKQKGQQKDTDTMANVSRILASVFGTGG